MQVNFNKLSKYLQPFIKSLSHNKAFGEFNKAFLVKRLIIKNSAQSTSQFLVIVETNNDGLNFLVSLSIDSDSSYKLLSIETDENNLLLKLRKPSNIITNESKLYYLEVNHLESPKLKVIKGDTIYLVDTNSDFNDEDYSDITNN